jgi:hypothetical protein
MMAATGNGEISSNLAAAAPSSSATEGAGKIVEAPPSNEARTEEKLETKSAVEATDLNDEPPKTFPQKVSPD